MQRTLGLPAVIAVSVSAMLGSGIFVLPGLAAAELGPVLEFRKQPRKIVEVERGFLWIDAEDFTD